MPFNLIKIFDQLLEIEHLNDYARRRSLRGVFDRDITENHNLNFRSKVIRPIKAEQPTFDILFDHLISEDVDEIDEKGQKYSKRYFEMQRSVRLHWIKVHLDESCSDNIHVFSASEKSHKSKKNVIRTYIYNEDKKYVVILDPQRSKLDYYLVTAFYINKEYGEKKIKKQYKNRLPEIL